MFFVQKVADWRRREFFLIHWLPTLIIFFAFMGVTLWSWQSANERAYQDRHQELKRTTSDIQNNISEKINIYQEILRAGAVLFRSSQEVTREEWSTFSDLFEIQERYPNVRAIKYIDVIPKAGLQPHINFIQSEPGFKDYRIYPAGEREIYTSLLYIEPDNKPNRESIGFDSYTVESRKIAIDETIKTSEPAITDIIYSPSDKEKAIPSIAIYYPIFKDDKHAGNDLNDVNGLIEVLIAENALFEGVIEDDPESKFAERISIQDTGDTLYESPDYQSIINSKESESETSTLKLNDTSWVIESVSRKGSGTPEIQNRPDNILVGGTLISLLMASFVYYFLLLRTRSIAHKEDVEIQSAKDELLALASHQLRTPATGVKQYLGMLLQGYAGHLTGKQKELLGKANDSNERQLTTINEMLSVARADAGRLRMETIRTDINEMVKDVAEEQKSTTGKRSQKVTLTLPDEPVYLHVDPQYIRMAIENIINNASKYTPEKGAIDIKLAKNKNNVTISVKDTGIGIPVRHYAMLFKKFSRIPNDFSNRVSGSGIGLYLAKHIVEAHGGQLTFLSDPGVGSTFKIVLPYKKKRVRQ